MVPDLVAQMQQQGIAPNLITFSTMLKGFSQRGDMHRAFAVLDEMRQTTQLKPDEIMYNTLLDGCAQHGLASEGEKLLADMEKEGIAPGAYTLAVMAKLLGNAKRAAKACTLVEQLTRKYNVRLTANVFANLIQGCIYSRDIPRAVEVFHQSIKERQPLDSRNWQALIRACMGANSSQVVPMLEAVLGFPNGMPDMSGNWKPQPGWSLYKTNDEAFVQDILRQLVNRGDDAASTLQWYLSSLSPGTYPSSKAENDDYSSNRRSNNGNYQQSGQGYRKRYDRR
jgi:pentatricopeptide repeat protein